jgi:hypothetical protein
VQNDKGREFQVIYFENLKRRDHSVHLRAYERIILRSILKKDGENLWIGFIFPKMEIGAGFGASSDEISGSIKGEGTF